MMNREAPEVGHARFTWFWSGERILFLDSRDSIFVPERTKLKTGTNRFYQSLFWKSYSSKLPFGFDEFNDPKYRDWFRDCSNICRNSASVGGIVFSWISLKYAEGNELEADEFFLIFGSDLQIFGAFIFVQNFKSDRPTHICSSSSSVVPRITWAEIS